MLIVIIMEQWLGRSQQARHIKIEREQNSTVYWHSSANFLTEHSRLHEKIIVWVVETNCQSFLSIQMVLGIVERCL